MISNKEYHADRKYLSSSGLKLLLKDAAAFKREYVDGLKTEEHKDHFTEGSLTHALILEPDSISSNYSIFQGLRKSGKLWEEHKAQHSELTIVSAAQMLRCQRLVKSYQSMPVALALLQATYNEYNMTSEVLGVPVKARADAISFDRSCIIDVKTTSMPSDADFFRATVKDYMYQLSAALYCQIAFNKYNKLFDFYWIVISKADMQCHVYKASTTTLSEGNSMVTQALVKYKKCKESGLWLDQPEKVSYDTDEYEVIEV